MERRRVEHPELDQEGCGDRGEHVERRRRRRDHRRACRGGTGPTASLVGDCPATLGDVRSGPAGVGDLLALQVGGLDRHGTSVLSELMLCWNRRPDRGRPREGSATGATLCDADLIVGHRRVTIWSRARPDAVILSSIRPRSGTFFAGVASTPASLRCSGVIGAGRRGERVEAASGLRERDHVADRVGAREQRHDPVPAERDAAVRRGAELEGLEEEAELLLAPPASPMPITSKTRFCTSSRWIRIEPPPISLPLQTMS